jgi:hypothetical protein
MPKKSVVVCARVTPEVAQRISETQNQLKRRSSSFVASEALERFFAAVEAGILPPIADDVRQQ